MVAVKPILSVLGLCLAYYIQNKRHSGRSPIVETAYGSLEGLSALSRDGREFYEYLGIPYAKPPVGPLRFTDPLPPEKWKDVRDAGYYGAVCLQADVPNNKITGEEDCLFLNVFVPKRKEDDRLYPTMIWIHGGLYAWGSSNMFRPEYFMEHDVILVTLNYRLSTLGFLSTGDEVVSGNMGLKDQAAAFKWVQENIKYFGGDSNQVTIFGESAGAISVNHHMLSPYSKGLFQRAISQSGISTADWSARSVAKEQIKKFSASIGCPTDSSKSMVECLRKLDGRKLMEASYPDLADDLRDTITTFGPIIEQVKNENSFMTEYPAEIIRKGTYSNKVPWMVGFNAEEGLLISARLVHDNKLTKIKENYNGLMPHLLWHIGARPEALEEIKQFYFKNNEIDSLPERFLNWTNLFTDSLFAAPTSRAIRMQSDKLPIYAYYYSYEGEFSLADYLLALPGKYPALIEYLKYFVPKYYKEKILRQERVHYGACHFDEVVMLFPYRYFYIKYVDKDYQMSKRMVKAWVDFASEPHLTSFKFDGVDWPPVNSKDDPPKYMNINRTPKLIEEPHQERNAFWNNLKL